MSINRFGDALSRLLCLLAFVFCFSGIAKAQNNPIIDIFAPDPTVEGSTPNGTGAGNEQDFLLTLSRPATQSITVRVTIFEGQGDNGALATNRFSPILRDYAPEQNGFVQVSATTFARDVTFGIGASSLRVAVPVIADNSYEFNENFSAFVSNPRINGANAGGLVTIRTDTATATIIDDDAPPRLTFIPATSQLEGNLNNPGSPQQNQQRTAVNLSLNVDTVAGRPLFLALDTADNVTNPGSNGGTAVAGQDYERLNAVPLVIPAGRTQVTLGGPEFPTPAVILGDNIYEGDEAFTVSVRYQPAIANTVPASTVITITDDDLPVYRVTGGRASEGAAVPFRVDLFDVRTGEPIAALSNVTFNYVLDDVTAIFPNDYTNPGFNTNTGSFTIQAGNTGTTINIPTVADGIRENVETFVFRINTATGVTDNVSADNRRGVGTIDSVDNDPVVSIANSSILEGTGGITNMLFTVSLSNPSSTQVTVQYETVATTTANSASPNIDYTTTRGSVVFPASNGQGGAAATQQTFTVPITTDNINETDETFQVRLFNPAGGFASFPGNAPSIFATGTIIDDDAAGTVRMAQSAITVAENVNGRTVNVPVVFTPNGVPARPVTVDFTTVPGTAMQSGFRDYFGKSGRLTFNPGEVTKNIPIEIFDDRIKEDTETFTVRLTAVNGAEFPVPIAGSTTPPATDTIISITDNEALPLVRITPVNARVLEGAGADAQGVSAQKFNVFLLSPSEAPVTVNFTFPSADADPGVGGTATNGADYNGANGSVTFELGGPTSFPINYTIQDDDVAEGSESFIVNLSKGTPNFNFENGVTQATTTIVDDDLTPTLTIGDASINEGNAGAESILNFPVTLSRASSRPVSFAYSTFNVRQPDCIPANGCDITSDDDYASVRDQVVTIQPGATTANIAVAITPDALNEFNEQFAVIARGLNNVVNSSRTVGGVQRFGTVAYGTIVNDDLGGVVTLVGPGGNIAEGYNRGAALRVGDTANFAVTLPAPAGRPVTLSYSIAGGPAGANDVEDLTTGPGNGRITIFPGDTTRTIALRARADEIVEGSEALRVSISITDTNGVNSFTTDRRAFEQVLILDRTPRVDTVTPVIGFPAYGAVPATQVTIGGSQLRTEGNPRVNAVRFGNASVGRGGITYTSDNNLVVSVPANAKTGPITLRTLQVAGRETIVNTSGLTRFEPAVAPVLPNFVVQPTITSFTPTSGAAASGTTGGSVITITGRNFQDPNNAVTGVRFSNRLVGLATATTPGVTVVSDTQIRVPVPQGVNAGPLRIVSAAGGEGPLSEDSFTILSASAGGLRSGANTDGSDIVEGSTGNIDQPVRNFSTDGSVTFHRAYQIFVNPAIINNADGTQTAATPQTPITVTVTVESSPNTGRPAAIAVRANLNGGTRPNFLVPRSTTSVDVPLGANYDPANPIEVAIVDAGTDTLSPVVGGAPSASVTVSAKITRSENQAFFPLTPENNKLFITVGRREIPTGATRTSTQFGANSTNGFSVPFASNGSTSVPITDVFDKAPVAGSTRNYTIYRFNAAGQNNNRAVGQDFVAVADNGRLERGVGYLIVTAGTTVDLTAQVSAVPNANVTNVNSFAFNLTRNVPFAATATAQGNATNGYNFIGFPFDPVQNASVDFSRATITFNGVDRTVADAAAAGIINGQLFVRNDDGTLRAANGSTIEPFKAYFVQIFRDNVTLTLNK